jgi:hypothetical protein
MGKTNEAMLGCSACFLFYAGFLLGLPLNPEDRDGMFLRNVS